jgi:phosphoribosylamine--glycine ligase
MNVLVIGQGGREHALVRALRLSPSVNKVHALPGNDGIAQEAICHALSLENIAEISALVTREAIDLVVVGPEAVLATRLPDTLRSQGVAVFAPSQAAARLENSKIAAKEFMVEAGLRTARFFTVSNVAETMRSSQAFQPPYVLKADGLAAGKGVYICKTSGELEKAARALFEDRIFGEAGSRALLEEFQPGYEISSLILTNGEAFSVFPMAQDHKRLADGDVGPNTGGMGVVAPVLLSAQLTEQIEREVVAKTIQHIHKRGLLYRGVLFIGLMMTPDGPSVLEFNTRFGDPETQALLPLLDGDWGVVFREIANGRVPQLKWNSKAVACVVLAAGGYPDRPVMGVPISGLPAAGELATDLNQSSYVLHAGTRWDQGQRAWVTAGGRVLNAIGLGRDLREAKASAYAKAKEIAYPGMQMRSDIGAQFNS